jgi:hypothetical protein
MSPTTPRRSETLWRSLALPFVLVCGLFYVRENVFWQLPNAGASDFAAYYLAAGNILQGQSPYLADSYIYPPALSFLITPIAALDYLAARWIWFLISEFCLLLSAWLIWRFFDHELKAGCLIALVWAGGGAAAEGLGIGQMAPILTLLLTYFYTRSGLRQGASAGLGVALKLIPGLLGVVLLLRRDWRAVTAMLIVTVGLLGLPWLIIASRLNGPHAPQTEFLNGTPNMLSWSVPSVTLRALSWPEPGARLPYNWLYNHDWRTLINSGGQRAIAFTAGVLTAILGVLALGFRARWRLSPGDVPLASAALISLSLAVLPVSWSHYQVLQYPGLALLLCYAARFRQWKLLAAGFACGACLYRLPAAALWAFWTPHQTYAVSAPVMFFWTSLACAASLVLFGLLLYELTAVRAPGPLEHSFPRLPLEVFSPHR